MAAGDVYNQGITLLALPGDKFDMQPPAGTEVVIHNITCAPAARLEYFDGTDGLTVDTQTDPGSWMGMFLHCTNSKYYRVVALEADTFCCCDGVVTKEA